MWGSDCETNLCTALQTVRVCRCEGTQAETNILFILGRKKKKKKESLQMNSAAKDVVCRLQQACAKTSSSQIHNIFDCKAGCLFFFFFQKTLLDKMLNCYSFCKTLHGLHHIAHHFPHTSNVKLTHEMQ